MAIKVYRSNDIGAPALTGQIGAMITFLDAVLVNGYNSLSVTSLTRSGTTATAVLSGNHGLQTGDSATVAGAAETAYNGEFVVTVVNGTTFTYDVAGSPATPATGTITAKRASAGFAKVFAGTNKAVYRSNDLTSDRHYLRVLDDGGGTGGTREARVTAYEAMTDVDTGTNRYPSVAQNSDGYYWMKSSTTTSVARAWLLITDGKIFYLHVKYDGTDSVGLDNFATLYSMAFGDILSYKAGDAYKTILTGGTSANSTTTPTSGLANGQTTINSPTSFASCINIARDYTAAVGTRYVGVGGMLLGNAIGVTVAMSYPHMIDNGFYLVPVIVTQGTPSLIRGRLPGAYEGMHGRALNNLDIIENVQGLPGKRFLMVYTQSASNQGHMLYDLTGPWDS
ncbi:TPA: hypothetical protein SL272_000827 [Pseudomonas aeruginosa]|nr:hypothetical protein [Pseudomonas aeruginosa]